MPKTVGFIADVLFVLVALTAAAVGILLLSNFALSLSTMTIKIEEE